MGCLANTKGILVTSSKSVTDLGLTVGDVGPLPLWPVAGVAGPVTARAPPPVAAIVTCSTLSKKWDRNKFRQDTIFRWCSCRLRKRRVRHSPWLCTRSITNCTPARNYDENYRPRRTIENRASEFLLLRRFRLRKHVITSQRYPA